MATQTSADVRVGDVYPLKAKPERLVSLDVLRGLILAAMILVNNAGSGRDAYWPLQHAKWNGWTPTDLIFPSFLFMAGMALTLSMPARLGRGEAPATIARHMFVRCAVLFAIGVFVVNSFLHWDLATLRIPGVLQRIAVCYLCAGLLYLATRRQIDGRVAANVPVLATVAIVCLVLYWALLRFVPVPGYGVGRLDPDGNLGAYIDRALLGNHLYAETKTYDPEGLLSDIPAIGTALMGVLCGEWLRSKNSQGRKVVGLIAAGACLMLLGTLLHPFFPINKKLWTSTFVLFAGGFTTFSMGVCYWLIDVRRWRGWTMPALVFGTNAIFAYTLSEIIEPIEGVIHIGGRNLHEVVYSGAFVPFFSPSNASLAYAICFVVFCWLIVLILYRNRIFLKI